MRKEAAAGVGRDVGRASRVLPLAIGSCRGGWGRVIVGPKNWTQSLGRSIVEVFGLLADAVLTSIG